MRVKRASRSGAFLIELIIAILFFAVASVICVQLFVQAHLTSRDSQDIGMAVTLAQNCAEEFKAMDDGEKMQMLQTDHGVSTTFFGRVEGEVMPLEQSDATQAAYVLTAKYSRDESFVYRIDIDVTRPAGGQPLFALTVKDYAGDPPEVVSIS